MDGVFQPGQGALNKGSAITVIVPGGTATTTTGTLSYLADAKDMFIQPNRRYLLVLSYNSAGQFYTLIKDWELVNGVVKANSKIEQLRATAGQSVLVGTNEAQLSAILAPLIALGAR